MANLLPPNRVPYTGFKRDWGQLLKTSVPCVSVKIRIQDVPNMKQSSKHSTRMFVICALLKMAAVIMLPKPQHEKFKVTASACIGEKKKKKKKKKRK